MVKKLWSFIFICEHKIEENEIEKFFIYHHIIKDLQAFF